MKKLLLGLFFIVFATILNAQTFEIIEGDFTWHEAKADAQ